MKLKEQFEKVANDYIKTFIDKQDMSFEFWAGGTIGGWCMLSDFAFNFDDVRLDIDNEIPKGKIIEWHNFTIEEHYANNEDFSKLTTNYRSWLMNEGLLKKEENNVEEVSKPDYYLA